MPRLPYASISPEGYRHLLSLSEYLGKAKLGRLLDLVYLRVSQINGCPYCVDTHWRDLLKSGEEPERLNALVVWRGTHYFTERERAALAWAESITRLRDQEVPDAEYSAMRRHFTDKEVVDLTLAVAHMNAMNRVAMAFHVTPAAGKYPSPSTGS
jgi:AhpD family alkylhydroperoxidase